MQSEWDGSEVKFVKCWVSENVPPESVLEPVSVLMELIGTRL